MAKFNKGETGWMSGDQIVYTGESEVLHGGTFHIANVLNGDGTLGKTVWIADRDEVAERAENERKVWNRQQAAFRRIAKEA